MTLYHCVGIWDSSRRKVERSVAILRILASSGGLRHGCHWHYLQTDRSVNIDSGTEGQ